MRNSLHARVLDAAERAPSAEAIVWKGASWTYEDLATRIEGLAGAWHEAGLRPGDAVALVQPRGLEAIAALYAASWLGCTYAPLDVSWPPGRIAKAVEALRARAWCCPERIQTALVKALPDWRAPTVSLESATPSGAPAPGPTSGGDAAAFALFTSGSTGRPKGVLHSHASALAFVDWAVQEVGLAADDRLGGHASLAFDLSTFDVFGAASAGAVLAPVPEAVRFRGRLLLDFMASHRLTTWYSVPSVWPAALDALAGGEAIALKTILFAGEVFPADQLRRLRASAPGARLLNLYGPTETNVVTWHEVTHADLDERHVFPSIGRPCPGVAASVMGDGELIVDGPTRMLGYLGEPPHRGPYHTGDRVRSHTDGSFRFCGRLDRQIKVRGHRIELGEIEAAASSAAGVTGAAAIPVSSDDAITHVEVFVTPPTVDPDAVISHCRKLLLPAAVPGRVHPLDSMPLTPNGKVDRVRLATQAGSSC